MGEPADAEKWGRSWSQDAERRDLPANNLYDSLRESNVIPAGEKLNGFVFLGTCSGSGVYEEMFAKEMEKELQNIQAKPQPWKKPLIISSDYAYQYSPEGEKESPIPKIVGDTLTEELQRVKPKLRTTPEAYLILIRQRDRINPVGLFLTQNI